MPPLSEETQSKLDSLKYDLGNLQESVLLTSVKNEVEEIQTTLSMLPSKLVELRTRGYVFRSFLEDKVDALDKEWGRINTSLTLEIKRRVRALEREINEAEDALNKALSGRASYIAQAENAINSLKREVDSAASAIKSKYNSLKKNVDDAREQVNQAQQMLDDINEASFQLYPAEDPVASCTAQFMESKKDGPKGILYLTDERIIFEQKEKIATKKVLFIATEKKEVQELIFEVPIGQIEKVKSSQKGFLGGKEMLELRFGAKANLNSALLHLRNAENEEWSRLIGQVKSGEIANERTEAKDEEAIEKARSAPTKCPGCGASLDVEIVRGMREIECPYCGTVIRL
ncbi:MAG: hypothetical protein B6I38_05115 [Anaerolineaceae bacterium 4572_5.1]|nr:MAG: hypothetical protein B5M51_07150 [Anaerolinea sp. 4484_236]OQY31996.1 MAG: hypothetical protein B6I38_05115 [Anaerolineaceae bacterium 4572_5.1]RLD10537.1 MAG: hypothetical protein DRI56_02505 [Chloroflexota bacterium]